ncbi:unnamed protein product, partial [Heterosigma akashiwo]
AAATASATRSPAWCASAGGRPCAATRRAAAARRSSTTRAWREGYTVESIDLKG